MNLSFNGFFENTITFEADASLTKAGVPVKVTEDGKAAPAATGDRVCGVAVNVRAGYAAVQLRGYTELPCTQAIPCGYQTIGADAQGNVCLAEGGTEVLVVAGDDNKTGFIL